MSHNVTPNTSRVELRKTLTLVPVVMMGLAYMQPMTLFDTFGIVSGLTDGHVPTAYAFALIAILFTALSYGKLVRRYPSAGSAYTYAQKSISPTVGFMVGWSSLLDYLFAPMINILLAKIYFEALVPSIPSWMFVVALVAFMTAFNLRSLKSVANFNTVIVVLQVVLIAVILGMVVYGVFEGEGAGTLASTRPFWSGDAHVIPMITGATILCFSFTGFDGISNLSEEKKALDQKVTLAAQLDATAITVTPLNKRSRKTKRIKNIVKLKIDFTISKNITAETGERTLYVRIMKPDNDVLTKNAADTFPYENRQLRYSIKKYIEYNGEEQPVTVYWDVEEFLYAGNYRIDIFADGTLIGTQDFTLD